MTGESQFERRGAEARNRERRQGTEGHKHGGTEVGRHDSEGFKKHGRQGPSVAHRGRVRYHGHFAWVEISIVPGRRVASFVWVGICFSRSTLRPKGGVCAGLLQCAVTTIPEETWRSTKHMRCLQKDQDDKVV